MSRPTWDEYFAGIAEVVSLRADCRRRQVGAVIVDTHHRIVSTGYNGAAPGLSGCLAGACPRGLMTPEEAAPFSAYDNCISIHAEANALLHAHQSLVGATIYVTCQPCKDCTKLIAGVGIARTRFPS
jgi:dCMP deaminase